MNTEADVTAVESQSSAVEQLGYLLKAMRPRQWLKNAFVFAGIVFAETHLLAQPWAIVRVVVAFLLFSLVSGSVYLINDLVDVEKDRLHPKKRYRPIASGQLSAQLARGVAIAIPAACLAIILALFATAPAQAGGWFWFGLLLLVYFLLQIAYSFALKHVVLVDLFTITAGFVLRAVAGAAVIEVGMTTWWLLSVFFLALFLGLGKRRNELHVLNGEASEHRSVLQEYSVTYLDYLLIIDTACTILVYSEATFSAPLASHMSYPYLVLTVPLVVFALFRYLYLIVQRGEGGEPADLLLKDRPMQISIGLWALFVLAIQFIRP